MKFALTVQDIIESLQLVEDKTKSVVIYDSESDSWQGACNIVEDWIPAKPFGNVVIIRHGCLKDLNPIS